MPKSDACELRYLGPPAASPVQARFASVSKAARRAAVTPANAGVLGDAVGAATAALLVSPPAPAPAPAPNAASSSGGSVLESALGLLPEWVRRQVALPGSAAGAAGAAASEPSAPVPAEPSAAAKVLDQVRWRALLP